MKTTKKLIVLPLILSTFSWGNTLDYRHLTETNHLVSAANKSITLLGKQILQGDIAPDFTVVDTNFSPVKLSDFSGKNILFLLSQV